MIHGAGTGIAVGGILGVLGGIMAVLFPPAGATLPTGTVLVTGLLGALFGTRAASMAGSAVPNSRHTAFQQGVAQGKILMMVDVPFSRTREISDLVHLRHPEALLGGSEPTIPAFS